jgi:type VI secretion system protein VasG
VAIPYVEIVHWLHQILQLQDSDLVRIVRQYELDDLTQFQARDGKIDPIVGRDPRSARSSTS